MLEICGCCFCRPTARNLPRSNGLETGRRLATHNRYFATLPEVLKAVNGLLRSLAPDRTKCCAAYAALLKTLCLVAVPASEHRGDS